MHLQKESPHEPYRNTRHPRPAQGGRVMSTDWQQTPGSEGLPLNPTPVEQQAAAARTAARHARSKEDLVLLLDAVGLPGTDDTLTALLPLLPETGDAPTMTNTTAPALSVHDSPAIPLPRSTEVRELLAWAATHPAASVRSRAARITAALTDLSERRQSEAAQREAEEKVAKARADLEKAQEELRTVKASTRTTTATATAPTPVRKGPGSGRTREELAAIRTWARANGHQDVGAGMVRKAVLDAYHAAHQAPVRKAG